MSSTPRNTENPKKALVKGTISYLESQGLPVNKTAIFKHFGLSRSQGYAALSSTASKRDDPDWEETRGRPSKIRDEDQRRMEAILWNERFEDVNLNWSALAREAGLEMSCNPRTLHRTMGTLGYRRCLECGRNWVHRRTKEKRLEYARRMLEAYPQPHDWRFVRFSAEMHFGFGQNGKMRLIPRPGEKFCLPCEDSPFASWPRDARRVHAWGAIGYGFKSELVFYEESTNPNVPGVLTMNDYRDKILEGAVGPWLRTTGPQSFVLEEDSEPFAHGSLSKVNIAQQWKADHGLQHYFSCGDSPDLCPLDCMWPPRKQWTTAPLKDWDDETLRQAVRSAWASLDQDRINMWIDFMPQRLAQVIETDGRLVPW